MGKTDSSTSRGLFRRFSSRRAKAEPVPNPAASTAVGSSLDAQSPSTGAVQLLPTQPPTDEEIHAISRMTPVELAKPVSMMDRADDGSHNHQAKQQLTMERKESLNHNRACPYAPLAHIGNRSPEVGPRLQTLDSADRAPVRRRSRAMQQMLNERALTSPSVASDRALTSPSAASDDRSIQVDGAEVASPSDVLNGLKRKQSISPAAKDYVAVTTAAYGSKLNRRKALLIGIGYRGHKHLHALPGCENDVRMMFELLTSDLFNFPQDSVKVLSDELETMDTVRVEAPTRFNILRDMVWLTDDVREGDSVVFFFAGHGDFIEDVSGDEVETGVDQVRFEAPFLFFSPSPLC